jgi:DNA-binding beta-propeller fold protein YncE
MALGPDGSLIIADAENNRIRKASPTGAVSTVAGSNKGNLDGDARQAQFARPTGVAVRRDGTIYISDAENHRIRQISHDGIVTTLAGSSDGFSDGRGPEARFSYPGNLALGPNGELFVTDSGNHRIRVIR